jgi:hypothetical protein
MQITTVPQGIFFKRYVTTITDTVNNVSISVKAVKSSKTESVNEAFQAYGSAVRMAQAF